MVKIKFLDKQGKYKSIKATVGTNLLKIAKKNHIKLEGTCGGEMLCTTCHVHILSNHINKIKKYNLPNPELELRVLLNNCSINNDEILLNNFNINKINLQKFKSAFYRRIKQEPISKIFNKKEFWSFEFYVNQFVLDPRPESEFLIQTIKDYFKNYLEELEALCQILLNKFIT